MLSFVTNNMNYLKLFAIFTYILFITTILAYWKSKTLRDIISTIIAFVLLLLLLLISHLPLNL